MATKLCPSCAKSDCFGHQHEYLGTDGRVNICRCSDEHKQHGKRRTASVGAKVEPPRPKESK
jgi:hypothetical protein